MVEEDEPVPTVANDVVPSHHDDPAPELDPFVDSHALENGTNIGGYVVDGELGRGGMGVVYSSTHPVIGKRAAIKVLKPSLSNNPATVERFIQEARSVNAIGHPNIVDIFDFDVLPDGRSYLVMDLLEGESLRKRVKRGPLHIHEATLVLDEISSALIAAHDKGFIHRDLKPDNVFLVSNPGRFDVKLLDFGLAKLLPSSRITNERAFRTATGVQLGTPDYMSPEQLRGEKDVDHRTDIYALGVLAFEIITGKRPRRFADGTFDLDGTPAEIVGAVPAVPAALAELVASMLADDPELRPSLAAIRAVIKRVRPSLPSMSVVGLEIPAARNDPGGAFPSISPSKVGARPVLPTPPTGAPSIASLPSPVTPATPMSPFTTLPAGVVAKRPTQPPLLVGARPPTPTSSTHGGLDSRRTPSQPPSNVSGLRKAAGPAPATRLGVAPAQITSRPHPVASARRASFDGRRLWLIVGVALALAAGVALAIVIAT